MALTISATTGSCSVGPIGPQMPQGLSAVAFCQAVKLAGYTPGIYMNLNTGYHIWDLSKLSDCVIWLSDPSAYPHFYYQFEYWPYSFTGSVPGIAGECDLNMRFMPRRVSSAPPQ